jgi:hypothetical protein
MILYSSLSTGRSETNEFILRMYMQIHNKYLVSTRISSVEDTSDEEFHEVNISCS